MFVLHRSGASISAQSTLVADPSAQVLEGTSLHVPDAWTTDPRWCLWSALKASISRFSWPIEDNIALSWSWYLCSSGVRDNPGVSNLHCLSMYSVLFVRSLDRLSRVHNRESKSADLVSPFGDAGPRWCLCIALVPYQRHYRVEQRESRSAQTHATVLSPCQAARSIHRMCHSLPHIDSALRFSRPAQ